MKSALALIALFVVPSGFSFEDHHGHIRGNVNLSRFDTIFIPTQGSAHAEYYIKNNKNNNSADESCGQTDSRRQLVEHHRIRRPMSSAELEESENYHNFLGTSISMLLDLNDTNVNLAKSSKEKPLKSTKDPKASKKSPGKNPKPKTPKPKNPKNKKCPKKKPKCFKDLCTESKSTCMNGKWLCQHQPKACADGFSCNLDDGKCTKNTIACSELPKPFCIRPLDLCMTNTSTCVNDTLWICEVAPIPCKEGFTCNAGLCVDAKECNPGQRPVCDSPDILCMQNSSACVNGTWGPCVATPNCTEGEICDSTDGVCKKDGCAGPAVDCPPPQDPCILSNNSTCSNGTWTCVAVTKTCELAGDVCDSYDGICKKDADECDVTCLNGYCIMGKCDCETRFSGNSCDACSPGYEGLSCENCSANYTTYGSDCLPADVCSELDNANGTCSQPFSTFFDEVQSQGSLKSLMKWKDIAIEAWMKDQVWDALSLESIILSTPPQYILVSVEEAEEDTSEKLEILLLREYLKYLLEDRMLSSSDFIALQTEFNFTHDSRLLQRSEARSLAVTDEQCKQIFLQKVVSAISLCLQAIGIKQAIADKIVGPLVQLHENSLYPAFTSLFVQHDGVTKGFIVSVLLTFLSDFGWSDVEHIATVVFSGQGLVTALLNLATYLMRLYVTGGFVAVANINEKLPVIFDQFSDAKQELASCFGGTTSGTCKDYFQSGGQGRTTATVNMGQTEGREVEIQFGPGESKVLTVLVDAPRSGTAWEFSIKCPQGNGGGNSTLPITYASVKTVMTGKGYKFFDKIFDLNLIGIRSSSQTVDAWDDIFLVLYKDDQGAEQMLKIDEFSTDPGSKYLREPVNEDGCAIVAPGQHSQVWTTGLHNYKYQALVQRGNVKDITVYRDNNKDSKFDMVPASKQTGQFAINLHHGYSSQIVGANSAGCQVFRHESDLLKVLALANKQIDYGLGNRFSYTLLDERDFSSITAPIPCVNGSLAQFEIGEMTVLGESVVLEVYDVAGSESSGVTLGIGYDIGHRYPKQVVAELMAAGMSPEQANIIAEASGEGKKFLGENAAKWVNANRSRVGPIALSVVKNLFRKIFPEYTQNAKNIATLTKPWYDGNNDPVNARARELNESKPLYTYVMTNEQWNGLHPAMIELITDMKFQGGYYAYDRVAKVNEKLISKHGDQLAQLKDVARLFSQEKVGGSGACETSGKSYMDEYACKQCVKDLMRKGRPKEAAEAECAQRKNNEVFFGISAADLAIATDRRNRIRLAFLLKIINSIESKKCVQDAVMPVAVPDCDINNPHQPSTCPNPPKPCYTPRAEFVRKAIVSCFPDTQKYPTTYVGHSASGNSMDAWHKQGAYKVKTVGKAKDEMDNLAAWLMTNHESLKIRYMIWYNRIWNPSRDRFGEWWDCYTPLPNTNPPQYRCSCMKDGRCGDVTQGHYDHIHITVE